MFYVLAIVVGMLIYIGSRYTSDLLKNSTYVDVPEDHVKYSKTKKLVSDFTTLDFETTGLDSSMDRIVEIGAVKFINGKEKDRFHAYVNPGMQIPKIASDIHGITNDMVTNAKFIGDLLPELLCFLDTKVVVAHNASFDLKFLLTSIYSYNLENKDNPLTFTQSVADTLSLSRTYITTTENHKLDTLKDYLELSEMKSHSAIDDAYTTGQLYLHCKEKDELEKLETRMVNSNKLGKDYENEGRIDDAIKLYEENVANDFEGNHPYDRLAIIYRKRKQYNDEIRVIKHAIHVFETKVSYKRSDRETKLDKFRERLLKAEAKLNN